MPTAPAAPPTKMMTTAAIASFASVLIPVLGNAGCGLVDPVCTELTGCGLVVADGEAGVDFRSDPEFVAVRASAPHLTQNGPPPSAAPHLTQKVAIGNSSFSLPQQLLKGAAYIGGFTLLYS